MMQLGNTFEVDGVTVFSDHADPAQFWYLATRVALGRNQDGSPAFSMIKYKPAVADAGVTGGGFLMFQSVITLPPATRGKIMSRLSARVPGGRPTLSPAPVEGGTVRCLALNLEGGGGTTAPSPPPGAFNAVTKILGATRPSMVGEQTAAFSLVLDEAGATILQRAFEQAATPLGVIYEFEYGVLTPDMRVEITADFERIYTHFSAGVEAQLYWVRAGIDAGFEKLVQDGAITIKVTDFSGSADAAEKEKWALEFFKNDLLKRWFEPSLDLGKLQGPAQPEGLDAILERLKKLRGDKAPPGGGGTTPPATTPPTPGELPKATLTIDQTSPSPLPPGVGLSMTPSASGTTETLVVQGPSGAVVTVDGQPKTLDAAGRLSVEIAAASTHPVTVDWPASPPVDETFKLFFTYDQPKEQGFSPTPSNPVYNSYLLGNPTPPDTRFSQSTAPGQSQPQGAAALRDWLDNRLVAPKNVTVTAHASFEGDASAAKADFNLRLTRRRLGVATGIIASRATVASAQPLGFTRAQGAGRVGDQDDRVVEVTGKVPGANPALSVRATVARAAQPGTTDPPDPPTGEQPPGEGGGLTPALLSFKLKFIRQEERKTLKLVYDRRAVVKRSYAPQGFIGLLLDELPDKDRHFVLVDLFDPFFQKLAVDVATPTEFADIGLFSSDVAIDYGDPADPRNHRHAEFRLTEADRGPKRFETFLNETFDLGFRVGLQHHFDASSGWVGERLSYELPPRASTDRTLKVDPADDLGFLRLEIFPNRIDRGIVSAIDVRLDYDDGDGFQRTDTFRVLPDSPAQHWKLRLTHPEQRGWTATFTHHLTNGSVRHTGPVAGTASFLAVDDPFTDSLDIVAVPLFTPGTVRQAFLDVNYTDDGNAYRRIERLEIDGDATEPLPLRIALLDGRQRTFTHRITIVGADGAMVQRAPVTGEETLIGIGL
ncbi:hypothetical protein [Amycolatopsis anabasis]|uniref:hypothetical protein n=1 Tax=Amycolatopsis anabasis TaxID=1840409 RepID=UPI00131BB81D|nr:hypothetical protein [Amycolatopsis anabasis]